MHPIRTATFAFALALLPAALSAGAPAEPARWQSLEDRPDCVAWNKGPQPRETVTWTGDCVVGRTDGRGLLVWRYFRDGAWKSNRYEGDMRGGKPHGNGLYAWADGNRYEGQWRDGDRHGRGLHVWPNGDRCEGPFVDGAMHGLFDCMIASGPERIGEWDRGAFVRWLE